MLHVTWWKVWNHIIIFSYVLTGISYSSKGLRLNHLIWLPENSGKGFIYVCVWFFFFFKKDFIKHQIISLPVCSLYLDRYIPPFIILASGITKVSFSPNELYDENHSFSFFFHTLLYSRLFPSSGIQETSPKVILWCYTRISRSFVSEKIRVIIIIQCCSSQEWQAYQISTGESNM